VVHGISDPGIRHAARMSYSQNRDCVVGKRVGSKSKVLNVSYHHLLTMLLVAP
jgi:hypothetical protein